MTVEGGPRTAPVPTRPSSMSGLLVPVLIGAAVSVVIGVYGQLHTPTGIAVSVAGFSSPLTVKVWLTSVAAFLAVLQLLSALAMWGRLPGYTAGRGTAIFHRWSGRAAFFLTLPVAMHCLYALGFESYDTRVLLHSLLGCLFYGAFTAKMLMLPRKGLPGWALPVIGGITFTALVCLWLTSSLWFFTTFGVKF